MHEYHAADGLELVGAHRLVVRCVRRLQGRRAARVDPHDHRAGRAARRGRAGAEPGRFPAESGDVTWQLDATSFAFDENGNGDPGDDPRHPIVGGEVVLPRTIGPVRVRVRDGVAHVQEGERRRGTLALPGGPMAFAVFGDRGEFGDDYQMLALIATATASSTPTRSTPRSSCACSRSR